MEHIVSWKVYLRVWLALMALMVATAWLSTINTGEWSSMIAYGIAVTKAVLVVLFFMHVKYESQKITLVVIIAGVFWLLLLMGLSMTDYLSRLWLNVPGH